MNFWPFKKDEKIYTWRGNIRHDFFSLDSGKLLLSRAAHMADVQLEIVQEASNYYQIGYLILYRFNGTKAQAKYFQSCLRDRNLWSFI